MGSAEPPGKMDEKLKKNEKMHKTAFFQYFRMRHFVVIFLKITSPQAALTLPNQNPADVLGQAAL